MHESIFSRPFLDMSRSMNAWEIMLFTDASRNFSLGFGGICGSSWMQARWGEQVEKLNPSIQYLELYAMTAGILAWAERFKNKQIVIFCDNMSVVQMVNNNSSKCMNCMTLIRLIVLHSMIHNVKILVKFVPTKLNGIADSLSRFQMQRFTDLTQGMAIETDQTPIPSEIWPITDIWKF